MPAKGTFKTEAVVLRSIRLGEADRVLHLYTEDRGRVGAVAKGVRKVRSRFGGRLEPLSRVKLVMHEGRGDLCTITAADTVHAHAALREGRATIERATEACEAVLRQPAGLQPALPRAGAAGRRRRAGHTCAGTRVPAQAAAGRRLRSGARGLCQLR
jgi:recombinational DNA repair protein (RecF pathway)